ncbi:MAG: hypothetical protein JWO03_2442 [Bacteroidetes bacterium]|nr:hypothetical protein [Bacteroidota bacterium]
MSKHLAIVCFALFLSSIVFMTGCSKATTTTAPYIGSYLTAGSCGGGGLSTYNMTITSSSTPTTFMLNNLGNQGFNVTATASTSGGGYYQVDIVSQTVTDTGGVIAVISGQGDINGNNLSLNYQTQISSTYSSCSLTATKQ